MQHTVLMIINCANRTLLFEVTKSEQKAVLLHSGRHQTGCAS